ncbi:membrane hypothetical protein [metagenome]|uniref:Metallophosphoesterase n=1 Tax=metagenome TaxID=256318 RepID=A0A2P2C1A9_9ZZZZ
MRPLNARTAVRRAGRFLVFAVVAAFISAPVAAEHAIERVRFDDRLGTLPVAVSLAHNGVSTVDTGLFGQLYWDRTGAGGFGALVRVTGPPAAGDTLSSYVSPQFLRTNAQFVNDPGEVARAYGSELASQFWHSFLAFELVAALVGGVLLYALFRGRAAFSEIPDRRSRTWWRVLTTTGALLASAVTATVFFARWDGSADIDRAYPMPGMEQLSFSSPQTLEVARQLQPFIEKNTERTRELSSAYEDRVAASARVELPQRSPSLRPRDGERIVIAEADPQGSLVGNAVRTALYPLLSQYVGEEAFALRTISGDVTSNGTVAEDGFVRAEGAASPGVPTVAVKGDHDTDVTVKQMLDHDIVNPDFDTTEINGLRVVAGNDPAFKTLFGGLVVNDTGVTESGIGERLREDVDPDEPVVVLLHQPSSAAGYIGTRSLGDIDDALGRDTVPWDDGIPDLPPGIINIGHLHDAEPPRVIWNTDGDTVTWTVVNQLGTSGGVEETPTFNRFSTPFSAPLKPVSLQFQYVDVETGLQTGYASLDISVDGDVVIGERQDLGLPGGQPGQSG